MSAAIESLPFVPTEESVSSFPKKCTKCRFVYEARADWDLLTYVGTQDSFESDFDLELRTCPCGTTLSIRIDKVGPWTAQDEREWHAEDDLSTNHQ